MTSALSFSFLAFSTAAFADYTIAQWTDGVYTVARYLLLYGCISVIVVIFHVLRQVFYAASSFRASSKIHSSLFASVIGAKMSFFSVTSSGAITSRFSADMQAIDRELSGSISSVVDAFLGMLTALSVVMLASVWYLVCMIPLIWGYYLIQKTYR